MYVVNTLYSSDDVACPTVGIFASLEEAKAAAENELDRNKTSCGIHFYPVGKTWKHELIGIVHKKDGLCIWEMYARKSCDYTPIVSAFITALANNDPIAHDMLLDIMKK